MHKDDTIEAVLAALGTVPKPPPKGKEEKLSPFEDVFRSLDGRTRELFYMLATYCFDSQRKLLYFCNVAYPFLKYMPEDLAETVREDTEVINGGKSWEDRAKAAEAVMLRLLSEVEGRPTQPTR